MLNLAIIPVVADGFEQRQQGRVEQAIRSPRRRDTLGGDGEERARDRAPRACRCVEPRQLAFLRETGQPVAQRFEPRHSTHYRGIRRPRLIGRESDMDTHRRCHDAPTLLNCYPLISRLHAVAH